MEAFSLASTPRLFFGTGKISLLPELIKSFGSKVILVTGEKSFLSSENGSRLLEQLNGLNLSIRHYAIGKEPTPGVVDQAVREFSQVDPHVIVAIGGGSVMDAGKAISAMLPLREPVEDYLEGVGTKMHPGVKIALVAIPTTAGTGSEATKNAVLSHIGQNGFKKSLRHDHFVPDIAIVDPELTVSGPPNVTAASGMDAFTQLLESYLSTASNPVTDALAFEGLTHISNFLPRAYRDGFDIDARSGMALASFLSGVTLANAGLGVVHGFASSIGGYHDIPHGVICSAMMASANRVTVRKLRDQKGGGHFLTKYSTIGKLFCGETQRSDAYYVDALLTLLDQWSDDMNIPGLQACGVVAEDFGRIVSATDNKKNPARLDADDMLAVLTMAS